MCTFLKFHPPPLKIKKKNWQAMYKIIYKCYTEGRNAKIKEEKVLALKNIERQHCAIQFNLELE